MEGRRAFAGNGNSLKMSIDDS